MMPYESYSHNKILGNSSFPPLRLVGTKRGAPGLYMTKTPYAKIYNKRPDTRDYIPHRETHHFQNSYEHEKKKLIR